MKERVVIIGTLDTKGREIEYLRQCIEGSGAQAIGLDVSCKMVVGGSKSDYSSEFIAEKGGETFAKLAAAPKAEAAVIMAKGASRLLMELIKQDKVDAVIAVGGGSSTALSCDILRSLPIGLPKIMISAVAASDMTLHIGTKDITLFNAVVDICSNRILRQVFRQAVDATIAMARRWRTECYTNLAGKDKPLVAATMYGVTQTCVFAVRDLLQSKGYEFVIFSGGGMGPTAMEHLAMDGAVDLVMDITTTSLIDEVVGGERASGEGRLSVVGTKGLPQVVAPGAIDIVNFGPLNTIPVRFRDRLFYQHTATTTLMRTNREESVKLAHLMAERLNKARTPVAFLVPQKGFSKYDHVKGPLGINFDGTPSHLRWYDPEANHAFIDALRGRLDENRVKLSVIDAHINDPEFAEELVTALLSLAQRGDSTNKCAA